MFLYSEIAFVSFLIATLITTTRQNCVYFLGFVLLDVSCLVTNHIIMYMKEKLLTNAVPIKLIHCWFRLQSPEGVSVFSVAFNNERAKIMRGNFVLKVYFSNNVVDFYSYLYLEWKITFDTLIVFSSQA